jgi:hypothetical protein
MNISSETKHSIMTTLIEPTYYKDIKNLIGERDFWRKTGNSFETSSKIFVGATSIVSFAAGIYKYELLSFFSGAISVCSIVFMQFSSYAYNESKERTSKLNKLLDKLKIDTIPDISDQSVPKMKTSSLTTDEKINDNSFYKNPDEKSETTTRDTLITIDGAAGTPNNTPNNTQNIHN